MANHQFYNSIRWQQARDRALRCFNYEDQEAKQYGRSVTATMVHHIYPVTDYPELKLQPWNLLPLSNRSHQLMHNRTTDQLTERGKYWQRKRQQEFKQFYAKRGTPPPLRTAKQPRETGEWESLPNTREFTKRGCER